MRNVIDNHDYNDKFELNVNANNKYDDEDISLWKVEKNKVLAKGDDILKSYEIGKFKKTSKDQLNKI